MTNGNCYVSVKEFARATGLSAADAYRLLADDRTRLTIDVLAADRTLSVDELARAVADREAATSPDVTLQSVRLSLVHVVLPKLDAHGFLRYDRPGGRVVADGFDRAEDATTSANPS